MLALGIAVVPSAATAQRAGDLTVGIMAGVNYATVNQDPELGDVEFDHRVGLLAGGFLDVRLNDVFSIEPEVLYSQKGAEVQGTGSNSDSEGTFKLDYIEVPVLLKFWVPVTNSGFRPFLFAGPAVGFEVNCSLEGEILSVTGSTDCEETSVVNTKSPDFGGTVGGGIEFMAGMQAVRVDARYTHGFTDINDSGDAREIRNRVFAVTVGLGWPFRR
jgi:hypothetical protein